jgi:hypothetical protein
LSWPERFSAPNPNPGCLTNAAQSTRRQRVKVNRKTAARRALRPGYRGRRLQAVFESDEPGKPNKRPLEMMRQSEFYRISRVFHLRRQNSAFFLKLKLTVTVKSYEVEE